MFTIVGLQEEELDESGKQIEPPGFHLLQLAYADDIRELAWDPAPWCQREVDDDDPGKPVVKHVLALMKRIKLKFDPDDYANPGWLTA